MDSEDFWRRAHRDARRWLHRYRDRWTLAHCDDLAQEASVAAWQWVRDGRSCRRFWALVHTITSRTRGHALRAARRSCEEGRLVDTEAPPVEAPERWYPIAGCRRPATRGRPWLLAALDDLAAFDRKLLLEFYEGFSCAELAERFRRSLACVKTRLHRARQRVQKKVEEYASKARDLDG
ncbi:MAG: sigma factor-like helix-turn-helix DNA-binding protein [Planctomycetota bacterium]